MVHCIELYYQFNRISRIYNKYLHFWCKPRPGPLRKGLKFHFYAYFTRRGIDKSGYMVYHYDITLIC